MLRVCKCSHVSVSFSIFPVLHILTYRPIAGQRLGKHIPAEANAHNMTSTARQRISKHASLTTEAVFPAWSVQSGYKEGFS
jgi:hypothetical protein